MDRERVSDSIQLGFWWLAQTDFLCCVQFDTNMDTSNHVSHQEQACAALETGPPQIAVTTASGLHISTHSNSCAHSSQSSPISSANSLNSFQLVEANEDDSTVCPLHPTLGDPQALLSSPMAAAEGPTDQISTADSNFVKGDADDSSMQPQASIASCVPDPLDACVPPVGGSPSNLRVDVEERFGEDGDASVYGEEGHVSHSASESCLSVTTRLCALEEERDNLVTRLLATGDNLCCPKLTLCTRARYVSWPLPCTGSAPNLAPTKKSKEPNTPLGHVPSCPFKLWCSC